MLVGMSGVDGINLCLNALSITAGMDVVIDMGLINQKNGLSCYPPETLGISGLQTKY
jgi:hypothetical protein